jgi:starch synthase
VRILMVASEAAPFAKTGGLADVVGALPRALATLGHSVDVVLPRYRGIVVGERVARLPVPLGEYSAEAEVFSHRDGAVQFLFVEHPAHFDREFLYGEGGRDYPDNPARFGFLCRAALEWAHTSPDRYEVIHTHDWQAGLVPVFLRQGVAPRLQNVPVICTIHNLAYQGMADAGWLSRLGLNPALLSPAALEFWGSISLLKGGIVFSDLVTTVSPRYAREIQTKEYGCGFEGLLQSRSGDLVGILNGIDYDQWDPARDLYLPQPFDASRLDGKTAAKRALLERAGWSADEAGLLEPLVGLVSRMVDQKGFNLLEELGDTLLTLGARFVVLGTGERRYEEFWRALAAKSPGCVFANIGFDEELAHAIEGGADLFLMPSRFEPCGLNQMYSQRYGTVPVVRSVGGLSDTVRNFDPATGAGTGFAFEEYSASALLGTLRWALRTYEDRDAWRRVQRAGMQQDFSWDRSAREYVSLYERAGSGGTHRRAAHPST